MKKNVLALILSAVLLLPVLCACGGDAEQTTYIINVTSPEEETQAGADSAPQEETTSDTDETTQGGTSPDGTSPGEQTLPPDSQTSEPADDPTPSSEGRLIFKQVYGTGDNNDTPVRYGFIELYNTSATAAELSAFSLIYMTSGSTRYTSMTFPAGAVVAPFGRYLIRCGEAKSPSGEEYDEKYEKIRLDYYDTTWSCVLDNKEITLALVEAGKIPSVSASLSSDPAVHTYFTASASSTDTAYSVQGLSKQKSAYRTTNTETSSFTAVDLKAANASQLADCRPQYSGGDRNTWTSALAYSVSFSRAAGFYDSGFDLSLSCDSNFKIYYTTDGSDPRKNGKQYTGSISVGKTDKCSWGYLTRKNCSLNGAANPSVSSMIGGFVVRAYATDGKYTTQVATSTYFVIPGASRLYGVPFISMSIERNDFLSNDRGIYHTVMQHPFEKKERRTTYLEIFESDGSLVSGSYVEVAMNGNGSLGMSAKSMRLYFKSDADPTVVNNPSKLKYDIFLGNATENVTEYKRLLLRNSGNDSSRSHLRDAFMQAMCAPLNAATMAYRPSLLFINGEFWGVYNIRERLDEKYFEEHFGVAEENFVMLEAPSPLVTNWVVDVPYELNEGQPGDEQPFYDLVSYINGNNMANATNYAHVAGLLDIDSFIDFFVGSMYMCNIDWPTNNCKVWRNKNKNDASGLDTRWRYMLCDMDMGTGLEANYDMDMFAHALNNNTIAGRMMCSLLNNSEFKQKFITRFTECTEKYFSPEKGNKKLDEMTSVLTKVIGLHFERWPSDGGSISRWNNEIAIIRTFINNRPQYALERLQSWFGIQPARVSISVDLTKADLSVNNVSVTESGYSVIMDDGGRISVTITPKAGYSSKGIKVVKADGSEQLYSSQSISMNVSEAVTVIGLVSKTGFTTTPAVVGGSRSVFVLDKNGNLYAWGENNLSQNCVTTSGAMLKPVLVASGVASVATSMGGTEGDTPMTALLTDCGEVYTVGANTAGQLGREGAAYVLTKIKASVKFKRIAVGYDHLLLLAENGDLYGCGNNAYGQLGMNNYTSTVRTIAKIASGVAEIAAGRRHTLYVTTSGGLYALGDNRWNKIASSAPEVITEPHLLVSDAKYVYAGQHNSLYISKSNTLYYFGWRDMASFGAGTSSGTMNRVADGVKSASIQDEHIVYLTTNGDVYGYGQNAYGQISGDMQLKNSPYLIDTGCIDAAAGTYYTAVMKSDGSVTVRGSNKSGVIGNGGISDGYTPPYTPMKAAV